jgi:hypothetical protein
VPYDVRIEELLNGGHVCPGQGLIALPDELLVPGSGPDHDIASSWYVNA